VTLTLELPQLSDDQVSRLLRVVEQGASTFDRILEEMDQDDDVDDDLFEAAADIADTWKASGQNLTLGTRLGGRFRSSGQLANPKWSAEQRDFATEGRS
jgi:light-regulated signal transduction histidine kinase (bacteriophytochrome)